MDLEGYEAVVINQTDFSTTHVSSLLVEDVHLTSSRDLDKQLLMRKGFLKALQLSGDALYVHRTANVCWPERWKLPDDFDREWGLATRYRAQLRGHGKLIAEPKA
jgi:hypothetical protein